MAVEELWDSCIFRALVVMNLWWKRLAAVVMIIMRDSWESLSFSPSPSSSLPPSFSGLEPVIMVLFTCNTLSNLFTILIHFAICVLTWISYIRLCHLFIFCELTGSSLSGFLLFLGGGGAFWTEKCEGMWLISERRSRDFGHNSVSPPRAHLFAGKRQIIQQLGSKFNC